LEKAVTEEPTTKDFARKMISLEAKLDAVTYVNHIVDNKLV